MDEIVGSLEKSDRVTKFEIFDHSQFIDLVLICFIFVIVLSALAPLDFWFVLACLLSEHEWAFMLVTRK